MRGQAGDTSETIAKQAKKIRVVLEAEPPSDYRIYAIRIGTTLKARRNLFIVDPSLPKRIEVAFSFWVVKGEARVILIDTGFVNKGMVARWNIKRYHHPTEVLKEIGLLPDQVTDVVITHSHWDHSGGLALFTNARIWITQPALNSIRRRFRKTLQKAKREHRLRITRSVQTIAPSVVVVPVGLHTPGFQYVVVRRQDGNWVFASDIAPLWANFERKKTTRQTDNRVRTLIVQDTILKLVNGNLKRIVPGHEPRIHGEKNIVEINDNSATQKKLSTEDLPNSSLPLDDEGFGVSEKNKQPTRKKTR